MWFGQGGNMSNEDVGTKRAVAPSEVSSSTKKRRRSRWGNAKPSLAQAQLSEERRKLVASRFSNLPQPRVNTVKYEVKENGGVAGKEESGASGDQSLDGSGHIDVQSIPVAPVSTLKINVSKAREKRLQKVMKVKEEDLIEKNPEKNPYFDPSLKVSIEPKRKLKSDFTFIVEGAFAAKAEKQRLRAEAEALADEMRERLAARSEAAAAVPVLPPYRDEKPLNGVSKDLPVVEWWDAPFLAAKDYGENVTDELSIMLNEAKITSYVHHPVRVKPSKKEKEAAPMPLMLTEKEKKRLRHQRRMDKVREQQELIQMGVIPPPPPKVKLSNMMRVLANESSADPTKVEREVRAQLKKRMDDHLARNEARKKTKEEKRGRAAQKAEADREKGLHAVVFRILDVSNPQHRFKIERNAKQLELTGAFVMYENCNVVVAEGGAKAIRKYKRLMLRRIDWSANPLRDADPEARVDTSHLGDKNDCMTVWEGVITQSSFRGFKTASIPTNDGCRVFFRRRKVQHYWDLAANFPIRDTSLGLHSNKN